MFCGDIVKDDSGYYAVFIEQGSSASHGRKNYGFHCKTTRLRRTSSRRSISKMYPSENERSSKLLKIRTSECPDVWTRLPRHKWPKSWSNIEDRVVLLERHRCGDLLAGLEWVRQFGKVPLGLGWEKVPNWKCSFLHRKQGLFLSVYVDDTNIDGRKKFYNMWKKLMKLVDPGDPTSFLVHVNLGCTQRECKSNGSINEKYKKMFEPRISVGATQLFGCERSHATRVAWSYDMEGRGKKCVERYCELADRSVEHLYKVSRITEHQFRKEKLETVGNCQTFCSQMGLECLYLGRIGW